MFGTPGESESVTKPTTNAVPIPSDHHASKENGVTAAGTVTRTVTDGVDSASNVKSEPGAEQKTMAGGAISGCDSGKVQPAGKDEPNTEAVPPMEDLAAPSGAIAADIEAAVASVAALVGASGTASFRRAIGLTVMSASSPDGGLADVADGERLTEATRLFVELLTSVDGDDSGKQRSAGFGELLLWYGKALVGFVRRNGATGAVVGDMKTEVKEPVKEVEDEDIGEDEEDDEELAWTQLETARVVFEGLVAMDGGRERYGCRLGDVHATLGELLLEGDEWEAAGREFGTAAGFLQERLRAEVLYKRYVALRKDKPQDALQSLKESVGAFEKFDDGADGETLAELREELEGFEKAVLPALRQFEREEGKAVEVKVVQPRKRARKE